MRISDWSSDVCSSDLEMRLLRDRCHAAQQQHIALVGRGGVESQRGERRQAGSLQDPCGRALAQVAAVGADMWRQQARGARLVAHFGDQTVERTMAIASRIALIRTEEHTSELKSLMRLSHAVFCCQKKKTK